MFDAFGNPIDDTDNLVAAGSQWTAGGNSVAARRARVKLQRRDRYGRWAEMGGGISFWGRLADGSVVRMIGRYIGPAQRDGYMRVYVAKAGKGYKAGVYEVPGKVSTAAKAIINLEDLEEAGIDFDVNGNRIGQVLDRDIESVESMFKGEANSLDKQLANDNPLTETEKAVQVKARLAEAPHASYNVVDENGNLIEQPEAPAKAQAPAAPKAKAPVAPKVEEIKPASRAWLESASRRDGDKIFWVVSGTDRVMEGHLVDGYVYYGDYSEGDDYNPTGVGSIDDFFESMDSGRGVTAIYRGRPPFVKDESGNLKIAKKADIFRITNEQRNARDAQARINEPAPAPKAPAAEAPAAPETPAPAKAVEVPQPEAEAKLPPTPPQVDVAAQKLAKDIVLGDHLIDTRAIERDPAKQHPDGKVVAITHDALNGTALITIEGPDGLTSLNRELDTPLGISPRLSRNGGNELNQDGNAAYEQYQRQRGNIQEPPSTPPSTPPGPADVPPTPNEPTGTPEGVSFDEIPAEVHQEIIAMSAPEGTIWQKPNGDFYRYAVVSNVDGTFSVVKDGNQGLNSYNDRATAEMHAIELIANDIISERGLAPVKANPLSGDSQSVIPEGSEQNIEEWIKSNLDSQEDLIDETVLTADSLDPLTGDTRPGGKTMLKNLKAYRQSLITALKEDALDGKQDQFAFHFALAKRVTGIINAMYRNQRDGIPAEKGIEPNLSVKDPNKKLGAFQILPNSVETTIGTAGPVAGKTVITKLKAVMIAKNGKPYLFEYEGSYIKVFEIKPDGSTGQSVGSLSTSGNVLTNRFGNGVDYPTNVPYPPMAGSISIPSSSNRALGLASGFILLNRWIAERNGSRWSHSNCLKPNGNFYSKTVSQDMRDHDRGQADKAIHQNNPNGSIFKVLKQLGLVNGTYKPYDPANPTDMGGSGWLRRIDINNTGAPGRNNDGWGGESNPSVLDKYTLTLARELISVRTEYQQLSDAEKARVLPLIPEIFRDHITGPQEDWSKWDVQYNLLSTVYKDGMKKEEAVKMLQDIIAGHAEMRNVGFANWSPRSDIPALRRLLTEIEATDFKQEDNNYNRPIPMRLDAVRVMDSPFAGYANFSKWTVPNGVKPVENFLPFNPRRPDANRPAGWTENPVELSQKFSSEQLLTALRQSIIDGNGETASLSFGNNHDEPSDVNPNAIFKALEQQGQDATKMLADIYDEKLGDPDSTPNADALREARSELGNLNSAIAAMRAEIGELDEPTAFDNIGGTFNEGEAILHADIIKRQEENIGGDPALNLQPLAPNNETWNFPNLGDTAISATPYSPQIPNRRFYIDGTTDNPKLIARNFSPAGLQNALSNALANRKRTVKLQFANGSQLDVPVEAIRDALQHQGVDVNALLASRSDLTIPPRYVHAILSNDNGMVRDSFDRFGSGDLVNGAEVGHAMRRVDENGDLQEFVYSVDTIADAQDIANTATQVAKLVRVVKNADGKYEVWVNSRNENYTGDYSDRTPDGIYETAQEANFDIARHIKSELNLRQDVAYVRNMTQRDPGNNPTFSENSVLNAENPTAEVNGIQLSLPDGVAERKVFAIADNRIPNAVRNNGAGSILVVDSNSELEPGKLVESAARVSVNAEGQKVETPIYSVSVDDAGKFLLRTFKSDGTRRSVRTFDTKENALLWAKYHATSANLIARTPGYEQSNHYKDQIVAIATQYNAPSISEDNSSKTATVKMVGLGGQSLTVTTSIKKGSHPAWRNAGSPDNRWEHAVVSVRRTDASGSEESLITAKITRVNSRKWVVSITTPDSNEERNLFSRMSTYLEFDTKTQAHDYLFGENGIQRTLGLDNDQKVNPDVQVLDPAQERRNAAQAQAEAERLAVLEARRLAAERVEAERLAAEMAAAQNPVDVNAIVPGSILNDEEFNAFLASRSDIVDLTQATDLGAIAANGGGNGASQARLYELNGKKYKVKRSQTEDRNRAESFNHALYKFLGIKVTEGGLGVIIDGNGDRKVVLADAFLEGMLPNGDEKWVRLMDRGFNNPENAQAVADLHEGLMVDALLCQWDLGPINPNPGNALIARDANGIIRGFRCDPGAGGIYYAVGNRLNGPDEYFNKNGKDFMIASFGDFMATGRILQSSQAGSINRGLTVDALKAIARRTLLPLTDAKIDAMVDAIITKDEDRVATKAGLKRRRREILEYMGIDPNESAPQGTAARAPRNAPGLTPPNLADDGYEIGRTLPDGRQQVRFQGRVRPDGVFIPNDWSSVPAQVKTDIKAGKLVPEHLPFMSKDVPADGVRRDAQGNVLESLPTFIDATGIVRHSPFGTVSLMVRKRKADGSYEYLWVEPGTADPTAKAHYAGKLAPLHYGKSFLGEADPTPQQMMLEHLGISVDPVSTRSFELPIHGAPGKHRVIIADIGDQELDATPAKRSGKIAEARWKKVARLREAPAGTYWNQFGDQNEPVIDRVQQLEQSWGSSPSSEPAGDPDAINVDGPANPPTPPNGGGGGTPAAPTPTGDGRDADGWRTFRNFGLRDANGDFNPGNNQGILVHDHTDGSIKVTTESGTNLGNIRPIAGNLWVATYMPDEITGRGGANRNGDAIKAVFASKEDADSWLAKKVYDRFGTAEGTLGNRKPITGHGNYNPNVSPLVEVKKGFLNETTDAQRDLANRLIDHKRATAEERALYRSILAQEKPTVGEVGYIINKLMNAEDRDSAEIAESRARRQAGNEAPIESSSLDNVAPVADARAVRAGDLAVGHRILGNVNGNVVFTAPGENNTMNVGVVGDDGKLRVYKVNKDSIIAVDNRPAEARKAVANPEVARRQARARLVQDRIKADYPNYRELPNGDLIVGQREHRQRNGQVFRYEAVVHKLNSDEFVSYVRKQELDANGNPIGTAISAYFTAPGHSPLAVGNRIAQDVMPVLNAQNPANGFNQRGDRSSDVLDPATGQMLPSVLVPNRNAQYIGETGIEKTGNPAKDALISYIHNLVATGVAHPDIIDQIIPGNQRMFSRQQLDDIIERLEANRSYPGVNAIPYVSKDNATIVRVGDRVTHYDADGNVKLDANGNPRMGTVVRRVPYVLNPKRQGNYEYTDQLFVKFDGERKDRQIAARRLEVNNRADGAAPVPAVQARQDVNQPAPEIQTLPEANAPANAPEVAPELPAQDEFIGPNGARYGIDRGRNMTRFIKPNGGNFDNIFVVDRQNGQWEVRRQNTDGTTDLLSANYNRAAAESQAKQAIRERDSQPAQAPVEPVNAPEAPATPENQYVNLPPNGRVEAPSDAPFVKTLFDTEIPRNQYDVVRTEDGTKFVVRSNNNLGAEAFVTVVKTQNGWMATDPRALDASGRILYNGNDRRVAEMIAINRMTGADGGNNPSTPTPTPTPAPSSVEAPVNERIAGRDIVRQRNSNGGVDFNDANTGERVATVRHTFEAPGGGQVEGYEIVDSNYNVVGWHQNEGEAIDRARGFLANQANAPLNPAEPASPTPQPGDSQPAVALKNLGGKDIERRTNPADGSTDFYHDGNLVGRIVRLPDGRYQTQDQFSGDITNYDDQASAIFDMEDSIANYANAGLLDTPDDGNGSDGGNGGTPPAPSTPPVAPANPANPEPDSLFPNGQPEFVFPGEGPFGPPIPGRPPFIPNGNEQFLPSIVPSAPSNPSPADVAPADVAPAGQAPRLPKPRVNPVKPGDRFVKYHAKRDGNYWDIIDRKTRKVIGRADTKEKADEIAAGLRGLDGKLIDYNTPVAPRPRQGAKKFPRPNGYKRTAVGQGYLLENTNDPSAPVSRVEFDRDQNQWVGRLYANRQDAVDQRNPIGSDISDASQTNIESKANESVQKELDRRNPPAPAPAPVAPAPVAQPAVSNHQRTDLGPDMFIFHDGNNEYGVAEKGADGKWNVRLHENPRDAMSNTNPIANGSFDSPEQAEQALREAIAIRNAPPASEMLQWQSGSDGKQYLGLDGIPGIDANNAPYYGISPGPFGGWIVAGWSSKADKDAGLPPSAITNHADENAAREAAKGYAQSVIDAIAPQQPQVPTPAPAPANPPALPVVPRPAPRRRGQQWNGETPPWLA